MKVLKMTSFNCVCHVRRSRSFFLSCTYDRVNDSENIRPCSMQTLVFAVRKRFCLQDYYPPDMFAKKQFPF